MWTLLFTNGQCMGLERLTPGEGSGAVKLKRISAVLRVLLLCLVVVMLGACGDNGGGNIIDNVFSGGDNGPEPLDENYEREPPPLNLAQMGDNQISNEMEGRWAMLDFTNISRGYVGAQATGSSKAIFTVTKEGEVVKYVMNAEGKDQFFPLSEGDGVYTFNVYLHNGTEDPNAYLPVLESTAEVALDNGFSPFLVNSAIVDYNADSTVVSLSYEIAWHAETKLQVVQAVYEWVKDNITYDTALARSTSGPSNYVPNLEDIISKKTGICYDYAVLVAAMLRANDIPCMLIKGNVDTGAEDTVYHAWNLIWLEERGWIAVEVPATAEAWNQVDLTFAASLGSNITEFVGSGEKYVEMSRH